MGSNCAGLSGGWREAVTHDSRAIVGAVRAVRVSSVTPLDPTASARSAAIFDDPSSRFEEGDAFQAGNRWCSGGVTVSGPGMCGGLGLFRVRADKVVEKLSYVKG